MGTLLNRRRYMGGVAAPPYDENSYIQDGLVFQLDGINKGATDGTWVDLVDGVAFTNAGSVTKLNNGWSFDATTNSYFSSGTLGFLGVNENFTVEVCIIPSRSSGNEAVFVFASSNSTGGPLFFMAGSNTTFLQKRNTYPVPRVADSPLCVGLNLSLGVVNGEEKTKNSGTDFWNTNGPTIGKRDFSQSNYFKGTIHAIRIYSKMLSKQDILYNQHIDNIRFNLGLSL